jgi:thiamine-monophosphate kinase
MPLPEKALIRRIRSQANTGSAVVAGIGDDCSVLRLPKGHEVLITTDFSLEGVHFRREWHPPESVGHRCLTRGLSDIAAMGGVPRAAFVSLALPRNLQQNWVDRFLAGFLKLAQQFSVSLAGGDTAQSPAGVLADIVVLGSVPCGESILRSGARPGDNLYVTGFLGEAAGALERMFQYPKRRLDPKLYPRHFFPLPRIEVGSFLRKNRLATAMIDLSDGLSTDLSHICEESGVGAELITEAIPRGSIGNPFQEVNLRWALHGGDDYELLFTAPSRVQMPKKIAGVPVTRIGQITRGKKMVLRTGDKAHVLKPAGWEHFAQAHKN